MSPHQASTRRRQPPSILPLAVLFLLLALCGFGIVSSTAQSAQGGAAAPAQEERELKNTLPDHLPIKVKLRNEKSFKEMQNKGWVRELELEVKNTGDKPIYFLLMNIELPNVTLDGIRYGLQLHYGRMELFRFTTELQPDDVPLKPGETVTLRVPESQVSGYEGCREDYCGTEAKKVELYFALINFGDGTGLRGTDGRFFRHPKAPNVSPFAHAPR